MNIVYLWYVVLFILLFAKAKVYGHKKWNDEVMSFEQTKSFLGFASICIVLHHCSQRTCVSWINPFYRRPGLEGFIWVGFIFVAMFFFCSGYALYKGTYRAGFFKRFLPVRITTLLVPFLVTLASYVIMFRANGISLPDNSPIQFGGPTTWHPYSWYIFAMILMYIAFYVGFGLFKNDTAGIITVIVGTLAYWLWCFHFNYGTWWSNSVHLFVCGLLFAKYETKLLAHLKKFYALKLLLLVALTGISFIFSNLMWTLRAKVPAFQSWTPEFINTTQHFCQIFCSMAFVFTCLMLGMKIRIGNRVLRFLGTFTLELYLVHGFFVHLFSFEFVVGGIKPLYYIENVALYVLIVLAVSLPLAYLLSLINKRIVGFIRPRKVLGTKEKIESCSKSITNQSL